VRRSKAFDNNIQREIHFNDIVQAALDKKESSSAIIDLIKLMKNEV